MRASELLKEVSDISSASEDLFVYVSGSDTVSPKSPESLSHIRALAFTVIERKIGFLTDVASRLLKVSNPRNIRAFIELSRYSVRVLQAVSVTDPIYSLSVRLPAELGGMDQVVEFLESSKEFLQYPALGAKLEPPKFSGCDSGSSWILLTFSSASPFVLTLACIGILFAMLASLAKAALMFKELQRYSDMSELQAKFLNDARETIFRDHRAQLEEVARKFGQLSDEERNEWISHLQNRSLKEFEAQLNAGMEIGYVADKTGESLKGIPKRFSSVALTATSSEVLQLSAAARPDAQPGHRPQRPIVPPPTGQDATPPEPVEKAPRKRPRK